jgi:ADP-heptose:LPS heptosyltransferase
MIYRCGALGDTIVAVPAINAIRRQFPDAALVLMTANDGEGIVWADAVLCDFGTIETFLTYRREDLWNPWRLRRLLARVRAQHVDLVVHLGSEENSTLRRWRDRVCFRIAGIRHFVGCRSRKVTFYGRRRRDRVTYPSEVTRMLDEIRAQGIGDGVVRFDLPIGDRHVARIDTLLAEVDVDGRRPLVGLCPGSKQPAKRWPLERYGELGRRLIEQAGAIVLIVGGSEEAAAGRLIGQAWPTRRWVNLAERLDVLESAEALRRCALYVGNDTGAMHIAAAVGTRCLGVFAARDVVGSWYPFGEHHTVIRKNVSCQNCFLSVCERERLRCLTEITVDDVWTACRRMLTYR